MLDSKEAFLWGLAIRAGAVSALFIGGLASVRASPPSPPSERKATGNAITKSMVDIGTGALVGTEFALTARVDGVRRPRATPLHLNFGDRTNEAALQRAQEKEQRELAARDSAAAAERAAAAQRKHEHDMEVLKLKRVMLQSTSGGPTHS
ncbi:hypothetical protein HKX48_007214 [Thoreauomyces humboldtii]|nr:hypothetical protein HKX48_007214 [Thoreauomyces humboldtii]